MSDEDDVEDIFGDQSLDSEPENQDKSKSKLMEDNENEGKLNKL